MRASGERGPLEKVRLCFVTGNIYIASAFQTVNRSKCGRGGAWIDNDPHFWTPTEPPTWGICRNDIRRKVKEDDYIFYVLPKNGRHPQMVFAWLQVAEKISHLAAYHRPDIPSKRMGNKIPNGNIIVDAHGNYNRFDGDVHKYKFHKIKDEYVIGNPQTSAMLDDRRIRSLAPSFLSTLEPIIGVTGNRAIDIITRAGRTLNEQQVNDLLAWLRSA